MAKKKRVAVYCYGISVDWSDEIHYWLADVGLGNVESPDWLTVFKHPSERRELILAMTDTVFFSGKGIDPYIETSIENGMKKITPSDEDVKQFNRNLSELFPDLNVDAYFQGRYLFIHEEVLE